MAAPRSHPETNEPGPPGPELVRLRRLATRADLASLTGGLRGDEGGMQVHRLYDDPNRNLLKLRFVVDGVSLAFMERPPQVTVGKLPQQRTLLLLSLGPVHGVKINGAPFDENCIMLACQGATLSSIEDNDWLAVGVSLPVDMRARGWPAPASTAGVFACAPGQVESIRKTLWRAAEAWAEEPRRFDDPAFRAKVSAEVFEIFGGAFARGGSQRVPVPKSYSLFETLVRRIDDFLDRNQGEKMLAEDVAKALGVSIRTIHSAMNAVCRRSLHHYMRDRRLWAARQAFLHGGRGKLIKQVALDNGFSHFGRFTEQYAQMFGEQPSETLRRIGREQGQTG